MPAGGFSKPWTAEDDAHLKAHYSTVPLAELAAHFGRTVNGVQQRAGRYGLISRHRIGAATARTDYFNQVDTPMKAYLLGLLAADGWVSPRNRVCLSLVSYDRSAVELLRDEVSPATRLKDYRVNTSDMVSFGVQSAELAAGLAKYGVTPAKTHTLMWPELLPEELAGSFVGGYFDGDGSLGAGGGYPRWAITSASVPFLEAIQQRAFNQTGTWIGGPYRDKRHSASSIVTTGHGQVRDLDEWIRAEVPGLARKRYAG